MSSSHPLSLFGLSVSYDKCSLSFWGKGGQQLTKVPESSMTYIKIESARVLLWIQSTPIKGSYQIEGFSQVHLSQANNGFPFWYNVRDPGAYHQHTDLNRTCLGGFVCLVGFLTSSSTTRLYRGRAPRQERLTILRAATHETELGDHDFCLSRSHYTDTDPTCRERAATAGIEPGTSSPGVARSTAELPRPPCLGGKRGGRFFFFLTLWNKTIRV